MNVAIDAMHEAHIAVATGQVQMPVRSQLSPHDGDDTMLVMPAYTSIGAGAALAVKVVSVFPHNAQQGESVVNALVIALDPDTGVPVALLEGGALTAIRTAAASGAATRALARSDSHTLTILGAGVQAHSHALAMCAARDIQQINICARRAPQALELAERLTLHDRLGCTIKVIQSADYAVADADIVCTTTASSQPLFSASRIAPGTHINAVGAFQPHMQEIPDDCVLHARVYVDHLESALAEAGDLLGPIERGVITSAHICGEVGSVLGRADGGRKSSDDVTLFKSVGNAAQDALAASVALANARRLGLGQLIER